MYLVGVACQDKDSKQSGILNTMRSPLAADLSNTVKDNGFKLKSY